MQSSLLSWAPQVDVGTRHVGDPPRAPGEEQGMHILCFWSAFNLCGGFLLPSTLAARFDMGGRAPASGLPPLPLPLQSSTGLCTSSFCFSGTSCFSYMFLLPCPICSRQYPPFSFPRQWAPWYSERVSLTGRESVSKHYLPYCRTLGTRSHLEGSVVCLFACLFWPWCSACRILVSWPGIELMAV